MKVTVTKFKFWKLKTWRCCGLKWELLFSNKYPERYNWNPKCYKCAEVSNKMDKSLINKYRPTRFKDVIGQDEVVSSIKSILKNESSRSFLFTGTSGCGKTTLARIIARQVGCSAGNVIEVDAATNTGIDDMRAVTGTLHYMPLGKSKSKSIIVDESHMLSKNSWASLLKAIEEPPLHVYWMLCTTEIGKVPQTIKTRCTRYDLKPINEQLILSYLKKVSIKEHFDSDLDENGILSLIANESSGSLRKALSDLASCSHCTSKREASIILQTASESPAVIDLCRWLVKNKNITWNNSLEFTNALKEENPESVRIIVTNYLSKVLLNTNDSKSAARILNILDCFSKPYNQTDKIAPLLISLGEVIFGE